MGIYFTLIWYKRTQYNTLNLKLSNSQLYKLKSRIKNGTQVNLKHSLNIIGNSNDEAFSPHKLLSTNTQVSKICKSLETFFQRQI